MQKQLFALFQLILENGPPNDKRKFNPIGDKIYELKTRSGVRILCFYGGSLLQKSLILTHGFFKPAKRVLFPPALPLCDRPLQPGGASVAGVAPRPLCRLPPRRRAFVGWRHRDRRHIHWVDTHAFRTSLIPSCDRKGNSASGVSLLGCLTTHHPIDKI